MTTDWNRIAALLRELEQVQRTEQNAILERRPGELPMLCERIEQLTSAIEAESGGAQSGEPPPPVIDLLRSAQAVAEQNHLLVQNHLRFLQDVFATVFPERRTSQTYDALGRMAASISHAGMILDTRT
jgi:hypothetical protein